MGFFDKIKQAVDASMAGLTGEGPSEEALASLSPEQRAAYDAQMARVAEAEREVAGNHLRLQNQHAERFAGRPLQGPAGEHLYGPAAYRGADPAELQNMSAAEQMEWSMQQSKAQFAELRSNPFGRKKPKGPVAADGQPLPVDTRPAHEVAASERAARDAARAPFLAPERWPITISRIATRGKTQVEEVAAWLGTSGLAGRPDLVHGVYRVPDRISPTRGGGEKNRVVEWDVVHAATEALAPAAPPRTVAFGGDEHWVARAAGEPSVLDEDLVLNYLVSAGIAPEQTLGIARFQTITSYSSGGDDGGESWMWSRVEGVHAFHAPGLGGEVHSQMLAARPLAIAHGAPAGTHVEVLNWGAIAKAVHPASHQLPECPSPFPYLPSTPQELLQAYLEVVGVRPGDSYGAAITIDQAVDIFGRSSGPGGFGSFSTNRGATQPCADGKARGRLAGARQVVLTYRDRPEYAAGRERWVGCMREAYQGDLRNETGARRPVYDPSDDDLPRGLRGLVKAADLLDKVTDGFDQGPPQEDPHRYCWPPMTRR